MSELQQAIGSVIRGLRQQHSLTLKVLAERAGLSSVYLGEIERGKKYPSAAMLEQLAVALDVKVADLLERVASALRGRSDMPETRVMGFTLPTAETTTPRMTINQLVPLLAPDEAVTMAELGAFFLARRGGKNQADE